MRYYAFLTNGTKIEIDQPIFSELLATYDKKSNGMISLPTKDPIGIFHTDVKNILAFREIDDGNPTEAQVIPTNWTKIKYKF